MPIGQPYAFCAGGGAGSRWGERTVATHLGGVGGDRRWGGGRET